MIPEPRFRFPTGLMEDWEFPCAAELARMGRFLFECRVVLGSREVLVRFCSGSVWPLIVEEYTVHHNIKAPVI